MSDIWCETADPTISDTRRSEVDMESLCYEDAVLRSYDIANVWKQIY